MSAYKRLICSMVASPSIFVLNMALTTRGASTADLSPFRICSSEVHKAERHAPIKRVEPALYAAMSSWEGTPEIDTVLGVCLAHLSRIFRIHGAQVRVHACGGALQNNFLRKLVHPTNNTTGQSGAGGQSPVNMAAAENTWQEDEDMQHAPSSPGEQTLYLDLHRNL